MSQGNMMAWVGEAIVPRLSKIVRTFQRLDLSVAFPHWRSQMSPQGLLLVAKPRHLLVSPF